MTTGGWGVIAAAGAGVAASPLLASWSAALAAGDRVTWWHPRRVSISRWAVVAAVTVVLVLLATAGRPGPAWWILAAGGAVLAVVDAQTHLLPARFTYPLAASVTAVLLAAAVTGGGLAPVFRAMTGGVVIGVIWLSVRFISPPAMGPGDVRLAALTGAMLGWAGWPTLWQGQVMVMLVGGLTAVALWLTKPHAGLRFAVPMGPAIILGSLLTLWL